MKQFKLPISDIPGNTFRSWASEIRKALFVNSDDLTVKTWEPVITASGSMTVSAVDTKQADYIQIKDIVWFWVNTIFTTGGVASTNIYFTLPVAAQLKAVLARQGLACGLVKDAAETGGQARIFSVDTGTVAKYDLSNFGTSTLREFSVSGCYLAEI